LDLGDLGRRGCAARALVARIRTAQSRPALGSVHTGEPFFVGFLFVGL
jgi:hypothetical protein